MYIVMCCVDVSLDIDLDMKLNGRGPSWASCQGGRALQLGWVDAHARKELTSHVRETMAEYEVLVCHTVDL